MKHTTPKLKYITSPLVALSLTATSLLTQADTVAVYDLKGSISESGSQDFNILDLSNTGRSLTHFDLVESLNSAIKDSEVKAVVLDVDNAEMSLPQIQEIRRILVKIRKAEKDVWLYTQNLSIKTAILGSVANHTTLLPQGNVMLNGLYAENMYFKGLMDKVGVTAEVIHIGDFKSAGETFYRTGPSDYAQKQSDLLLDSMYQQIIQQIAEGRGIELEKMKSIVDMGMISAKQALELKLVDHLEYRTDFINIVRDKYGSETTFDKNYMLPNLDGPEINGFMDIIKLAFKKDDSATLDQDYIAVITLDGDIDDGSIAPVRTEILKAKRNKHCKAIVFRINSPGGSALSSDVLWEATEEFKATGRPMVVSMGAVAASGGYYVAAGADHIYAEQGTITGSIGVVGMKFVVGDAMEKLGITTHSSQRGKHADIWNTSRSYTEAETKIVRDSMLDVYGTFKKRITDGRGDKIKGDIESLAGGRVYSGLDALNIGLVDEIGGLNEAIDKAATLAKLDTYNTFLFPKPKSGLEGMLAKSNDSDAHEFIGTSAPKAPKLFTATFMESPALRLLGADKQRQIIRFVNQVESFQNNQILLISPAFNTQLK